jgi:putative redox protein
MYCGKKRWAIETVLVSLELFGKPGSWEIRRAVQILGDLTREQSGRLAEVCERTPVTLAVRRGVNVQTTVSVQLPA